MCVTLHPDIVDQVLCLCDTQIRFDLEKKWPKKVYICDSKTTMLLKIHFTAPCIQYYISGWKMFFNNRIILEVPLASVTLALDAYSKQQK